MGIRLAILRFSALGLVAAILSACAPVPPREAAVVAGIQSSNWKANRVFGNNIAFEQPTKKNRFSNSLEIALRNVGWYATSPTADYRLSYQLLEEQIPKQFKSGSEGRFSVRYVLKDRNQNEVLNRVVYTSGKLGVGQSLAGAEGVARVVEAYANDSLRELFAELGSVGASIYDKQQTELSDQRISEQFNSYDLFSDTSFFEGKPYSGMSYGSRTKLLKSTKSTWMKKLRTSSAHNCQKFLNTYDSYLDSEDKAEVSGIISQKKAQANQGGDKPVGGQSKPPVMERKNPF